MGVNQAIADLVAGVNDGVPGLNNLQEALDFAGSFGNPIGSVQTAGSTLDALNEQIGALLGNVCYASSQALCLNVVDCSGPCSGDEVATTLSVDMSCSGTDMRPPVVAVPVDGALVEVVTMDDADGDDIWEAIICVAPGTEYEYKYVTTGFAEEENLVDDAIGGATCVGNTDFSAYANRVITIPEGGGVLPTDTYGSCGTCDNPPVSVTFNVDMGCSDIAAGTQIAVTGPFTGWCDGCAPMADPEGDNIWASNTYAFPADDSGCIFIEYLYQAPNWGNAESLPTNGEDLSLCPGNVNIVDSYANHLITICNAESTDVIVNDYWNTCFAPTEPTAGCDDGDCSNGVETWDGCACVEGTTDEIPVCDDGDCTNGLEIYNETTCSCDPGTPPVDPGCDDGDCSNGVETWDGCECVAGEAPVDPGCDDGDCSNGVETWDGCQCVDGVAGEIPMCDDGDCSNGVETYDEANCECVPGEAPVDPGCDDGDCSNGLETWDGCECVAGETPVDPGCDDGDCSNGVETWDGCECVAGEAPVDPGCDDGDCSNGVETWDGCECVAGVAGEIPMCDDGDCSNGVETYDADNCVCVAGTAPVDPGCDDGDCSNGVETWDGCDCVAGTPGETPECDDGDCSNGVETYDAENCECVPGVAPMDPGCDDGICSNGLEVWDGCECVLPGIPEPLVCDDGNCGNGLETYNEITCSCDPGTPPTCADGETLNEDCDCVDVLICEDPCATNFGASEACEPYEMTCPEDTCFEQYTWDAEGCECIVAVVDYFCDDDNECTNDYVDEVICECVNEEIPGCGDPDPTCPTPGVIEDCGYELSQERLNAIAAFVVSETGGSFPHGGMGLTADQTIRDIFTSDGNVGNEINPGFLITKHTYALDSSGNKGDLLVTFAMLKHFEGYWEDSNDWEYIMIPADPAVDYTVNPNGILANAAVSGNVHDMNPGCISCHNGAGGGDQLFSND